MRRLPVQRVPARGRLEGARCNRGGYANYPLHPHLNQVGSDVEPTELIEGDLDSPQRKRFIRSLASLEYALSGAGMTRYC